MEKKGQKMAAAGRPIRQLNDALAQCAQRKQINEAETLYDRAMLTKSANRFTHGIMVNVYVRCGLLEKAYSLLQKMHSTYGIAPGVVACTSLMKGFCSAGSIRRAIKLLEQMESGFGQPNLRTANTLLRLVACNLPIQQSLPHLRPLFQGLSSFRFGWLCWLRFYTHESSFQNYMSCKARWMLFSCKCVFPDQMEGQARFFNNRICGAPFVSGSPT